MTASTESYRETLARLKRQVLASRFLRWWLGELASMVPAWLRAPRVAAAEFQTVSLQGVDSWRSTSVRGEARPLALTLPKDSVLQRNLTLPLATEENLRQVLEFQLEQLTPFAPGDVYFGYEVLARDFERGQLKIAFVVTPRDAVDAAVKTLEGQGSPVHAVFVEELLNRGQLINLLPRRLVNAPSPLWQGANLWLFLLSGILVLATLAMPLVIKREAVIQLLPWVEKGKKAAEAVDVVRRELDVRIEQHNFVLEKRRATPPVIQVLEELTRVLPDDTWVQTIDLKGKELQIQGETASSVRLIGLFEQSPLFKDASFRSPLTKGQTSGSERYQLSLQVRPAPLPASAPVAPLAASSSTQPASAAMPAVSAGGTKP
jgi:general secretion pathway protein L